MNDSDLPPPSGSPHRPKHASLVEIVEEAVDQAVVKAVEKAVKDRFDSLIPMNEEQLAIAKRSESEREKRVVKEAEKRASDKRWREYKRFVSIVITIIVLTLEIYRSHH
jgi:hypothetical protein